MDDGYQRAWGDWLQLHLTRFPSQSMTHIVDKIKGKHLSYPLCLNNIIISSFYHFRIIVQTTRQIRYHMTATSPVPITITILSYQSIYSLTIDNSNSTSPSNSPPSHLLSLWISYYHHSLQLLIVFSYVVLAFRRFYDTRSMDGSLCMWQAL